MLTIVVYIDTVLPTTNPLLPFDSRFCAEENHEILYLQHLKEIYIIKTRWKSRTKIL